jgi:tetratricopeptide (TPR) repeat protein
VYVVDDMAAIRKLAGSSGVGGFYLGRADGAVAFTPRRGDGSGPGALEPQIVLFHEYAHHFLLSNSSAALPAWFSEGYAEFAATARVLPDAVTIGNAAQHRAWGLFADDQLSLEMLFAPPARMTLQQRDQLYGRGWLLTHYLIFDAQRQGSFRRYITLLNGGMPPLKAAVEAFGDLKELNRALRKYLMARKLPAFSIPLAKLPAVKIDVRALTPGERALIETRMVSTRGVDEKAAATLYARAVRAVAPHGNDVVAQGWLAEMAYDAKRDDEAEAAADRALAVDPRSIQALLYKARVHLRRAEAAGTKDPKIWREARSWITRANRVDPDGAAALQLFYDSFGMEGAPPNASAVKGLHYALLLAPQDQALRFRSVTQHLKDGEIAEARRALRPLAFDPHGGADNPAAKLMALIDRGATGPAALAALEQAGKTEAAGGANGAD